MARSNRVELNGVPLVNLTAEVLQHSISSSYIHSLCEKLNSEGIVEPSDLLRTSRKALKLKLTTHSAFFLREMADILTLREKIEMLSRPSDGVSCKAKKTSPAQRGQRSRSRSRRRDGKGVSNRDMGSNGPRCNGPQRGKPPLWEATENGQFDQVAKLIAGGCNLEEKWKGWSPLMKAAEEGHAQIVSLLIDKRADLSAANS